MYFWKVDNLIDDLKSNKVNQKEEFKYILLFFVSTIFSSDPILFANTSYNIYNSISSVINVTLTIIGLYYCYKVNADGDNKEFMKRVVCIGLPVMVRLFVIFTPISFLWSLFVYYVIQGNSMGDPIPEVHEQNLYHILYLAVMVGIYYLYLSKKIKKISNL
jgi:hypothetical protein